MAEKASAESGAYGQLMREFFTRKDGLPGNDAQMVAIDARDRVWVATSHGVACYDGKQWQAFGPAQGLQRGDAQFVAAVGGDVYAATATVYHLRGKHFEAMEGAPAAPFFALRAGHGRLAVAAQGGVSIFDGAQWERIPYPQPLTVTDLLLDGDGVLWLASDKGLWSRRDESWQAHPPATEHTGPPAEGISALALDGAGTLWVGTTEGIGLFDRSDWWERIKGKDGLPYERISSIAVAADGAVWVGFTIGCARLRGGDWDYFANLRWLPDDQVLSLAVAADGSAWVGTPRGLARIHEQPMTLAHKAAHFEEILQQRHYRHGYVADCHLEAPGDVNTYVHEASDNDGLWTALYVAAESYRYAVTGDEEARDRARTSVYAMIDLERKSAIPGFPARAVARKDERVVGTTGGEWHDTEDGEWIWKADTSSDETDGHFYAYALYYDLVADDADKEEIRGICRRIMDHIIDHGYLLVDLDGKHTMWGVWAPELLNGPWEHQRGLNSLEILAYLKVTHHVTGDDKYHQHYLHLARDHHYALNTLYQKICYPASVNHSDDELAIVAYDPLLRYEDDPALRAIYVASLERTWRIERPEQSPFQNYIYGAVTGKFCDVEESLRTLWDMPWDPIVYTIKNSHRTDLVMDVRMGRFGERQSLTVLKPHERAMMRWNGNPYRFDGGHGGHGEDDGVFFLLPYWMGRYYGFVKE